VAGLANSGRQLTLVAATLGLAMAVNAQTAHIDINAAAQGTPISPVLYGIFFEEINHAGDGGLYAELVRNRSFEDADTPQAWTLLGDGAKMAIDTVNPLNSRNPRSLRLEIAGSASLVNEGYWGIAVQRGRRYRFTMYARFYDAIKARYPQIQLIATAPVKSRPIDILDEHYYASPEWFILNANLYDRYDRTGPEILVGEYALTAKCGTGNLRML
jgi:hypothetical protein